MRIQHAISALFLTLIAPACLNAQAAGVKPMPQQPTANLSGIWQAQLDGLPSLILTLAEDTGSIEGTLVLNGINSDVGGPHIAVHEVHVLLHPSVSGMTLSFAVKSLRGSKNERNFTVEQISETTAKIRCLNCGNDAPSVEITRLD